MRKRFFRVLAALAALSGAARADIAYVSNSGDGTVSVIDTGTDAVVRTFAMGSALKKPQGMVISTDGRTLLVNDGQEDANGAVAAIDTASGKLVRRIVVGPGPEGIGRSPGGREAATCVEDANRIVFLDIASLTKVRTIGTRGHNPEHCVYVSGTHWLLAANEESNDIDVIDLSLQKSTGLIPTIQHPRGMDVLPDGSRLYIANEGAGLVQVVRLPDMSTITTIATGTRTAGILVSPDGKRVYASNGGSGTVSVIDAQTNEVVATVKVGLRPWNMALTRDGAKLYVACGRSGAVSVIDTASNSAVRTIGVGKLPWGVVIH